MSLLETVKAIASAHGADSIHIQLCNDLTAKPQVEILAFLPLDETIPVRMPTSN
jgi:hypothetical protein